MYIQYLSNYCNVGRDVLNTILRTYRTKQIRVKKSINTVPTPITFKTGFTKLGYLQLKKVKIAHIQISCQKNSYYILKTLYNLTRLK